MNVVAIKRERLVDQVYEILRGRILSRDLVAGQRLSVPSLADELGTSRSPIREAVQRLVIEGLAWEKPNHGAVVASPDRQMLVDLYQVRAPLEGLAAALTASAVTPASVQALTDSLTAHRAAFEARDTEGVLRADMNFHLCIAQSSGNAELNRVLAPIYQRMTLGMLAGRPEAWPAKAIREHEAILDAIRSGDAPRARAKAERHVLLVRERLMHLAAELERTDNPPAASASVPDSGPSPKPPFSA